METNIEKEQGEWTNEEDNPLNTDGSMMGNPGKGGAGGLIDNNSRRWLGGFTEPFGLTNSLQAKAWALQEGLLLARFLSIQSICIELDAKVLYDQIWGISTINLHLFPLILDCRRIMAEFRDCQVILIYREANVATDFLAKPAWDQDGGQNSSYFLEHPHRNSLILYILIFLVLPTQEM